MVEPQRETLYDHKSRLGWVEKLRWSDKKLRKVPVHLEQTDRQPFISLPQLNPPGPTNLYIYKDEVPEAVWATVSDLVARLGSPSGYEQQGMEGTRLWEHKKGRERQA